jgi:hypothetical protein
MQATYECRSSTIQQEQRQNGHATPRSQGPLSDRCI